jgi:hypothetical protein
MELVSHGDMVSPVILHIATSRLAMLMKKAIHRIMAGIGFPRNFNDGVVSIHKGCNFKLPRQRENN